MLKSGIQYNRKDTIESLSNDYHECMSDMYRYCTHSISEDSYSKGSAVWQLKDPLYIKNHYFTSISKYSEIIRNISCNFDKVSLHNIFIGREVEFSFCDDEDDDF